MDLQSFCSLIIKHLDKKFHKQSNLLENKFKKTPFINDDIAKIKVKSVLPSLFGLSHLNFYTSRTIEECSIKFGYCLKILELYPVKGDDFFYWNEHVRIFSQLEKNNFSNEEDVSNLHIFLKNNFNFIGNIENIISHQMLKNVEINLLLIILHLDHLISRKWNFKSIPLNHVMKFKYKKETPYYPSKTFADFLLFILITNSKFESCQGRKFEIPNTILATKGFEQWLDPSLDDDESNDYKQLIKKMRENKRFCYLNEVYGLLGLTYSEFKDDEEYERISKENYLFLRDKLPEEERFESINAISGLWLIYFWQDFYFKHMQKMLSLPTLATSQELIDIWDAFLTKYPSEGKHTWPSEFMDMDK